MINFNVTSKALKSKFMYELNRGKINDILFEESNDEQIYKYFELLRANSIEYSKKASESFKMILILTLVWFLFKFDKINSMNYNGFGLKSIEWISMFLPILMIYFYYRYISHNLLFVSCRDLMEDFYQSKFAKFHQKDMTQLLHYPSLEVIEYITNYAYDESRKKPWWDRFISLWVWVISIVLFFLPGIGIVTISIYNLFDLNCQSNYIVLMIVLGFVAITIMRIVTMYFQMKRLIR